MKEYTVCKCVVDIGLAHDLQWCKNLNRILLKKPDLFLLHYSSGRYYDKEKPDYVSVKIPKLCRDCMGKLLIKFRLGEVMQRRTFRGEHTKD